MQKIIEEYKVRKTGKSFRNGFDLPKYMTEHLYMFAGENETDIFRVKKKIIIDCVGGGSPAEQVKKDIKEPMKYSDFKPCLGMFSW